MRAIYRKNNLDILKEPPKNRPLFFSIYLPTKNTTTTISRRTKKLQLFLDFSALLALFFAQSFLKSRKKNIFQSARLLVNSRAPQDPAVTSHPQSSQKRARTRIRGQEP